MSLDKNPPGMALKFKNLTGDESLMLKNYARKLITEDILDSQEEVVIEKYQAILSAKALENVPIG